jgi:hypothetical protein
MKRGDQSIKLAGIGDVDRSGRFRNNHASFPVSRVTLSGNDCHAASLSATIW